MSDPRPFNDTQKDSEFLIPYKDAQKYSEFSIPERTREKIQSFWSSTEQDSQLLIPKEHSFKRNQNFWSPKPPQGKKLISPFWPQSSLGLGLKGFRSKLFHLPKFLFNHQSYYQCTCSHIKSIKISLKTWFRTCCMLEQCLIKIFFLNSNIQLEILCRYYTFCTLRLYWESDNLQLIHVLSSGSMYSTYRVLQKPVVK